VKALEQTYGASSAVYGSGWKGPSAKGPREFDEQQRLNAGSRIAAGIECLFSPWYFSNRLPIALACGVPLIYRRNPGFDQVFGKGLAADARESSADADPKPLWRRVRPLISGGRVYG